MTTTEEVDSLDAILEVERELESRTDIDPDDRAFITQLIREAKDMRAQGVSMKRGGK